VEARINRLIVARLYSLHLCECSQISIGERAVCDCPCRDRRPLRFVCLARTPSDATLCAGGERNSVQHLHLRRRAAQRAAATEQHESRIG